MLKSFFLLLGIVTALQGQAASAADAADTLTIEQALARHSISTPLLSPDGSKAVVAISPISVPIDSQVSHLWLLDLKTKEFRQFTSSAKAEYSPRWSPDSKQLAFLSARNGTAQIFLLSMDGGEALPLTTAKTGVSSFEWAPDGQSLVYLAQDELGDSLKKRRDQKFDETVVGEATRPTGIYRMDIATKKIRQLTKQLWEIHEMKWLPSGNQLLLLYTPLPDDEIAVSKLTRFNLADSTFTALASPPHGVYGNFVVSPDGKLAAFYSARETGPVPHDLFIHRLDANHFGNITEKTLDRPVYAYKFTDDHTLLGLVQEGFENRLYSIGDNGAVTPRPLKANIQSFDVARDGTLVYVSGSFTQLPELYVLKPGGEPEKVSGINKTFDSISLAAAKVFTYKSFDGKLIEAALYLPAHHGAKVPLIALIHGGPTSAFGDAYSAWAQLLVQSGYAVFCPNIRGSTGYGFDFLAANRKDWGGNDYKDMMAGIDYLIKTEPIDGDRLGISGWSYGGYMAEWAITQTHRFKASVSGAGMANLASEFGTEDGVSYDSWFWGVPYENLDLFVKHSPIAFLKNVTTPTLIIQGEEDETDPKGQSQELYRGLHYYHVPSELVIYPREPHGFREPNHNIDFYRRMLAWFTKYL